MIGASIIFCFTSLKALTTALVQTNSPCFHAISDGGHNGVKPLDESVIKGSEPMEALNFMDIFGLGPIHNRLNLLGVSRNSLRGYYET